MDRKKTMEQLQTELSAHIPGDISNGALYSTHFSSVPFSLMIHEKDNENQLYHIQYMDLQTHRKITFHITELSDELLYTPAPFHNHNFYELTIITSGEIQMTFEGLEYTYHTGDTCILNRNILHNEGGDSYEAVFLSISPDYIRSGIASSFTDSRQAGALFSCFFQNDLKNELQHERDYIEFFCKSSENGKEMLFHEIRCLIKEMKNRRAGCDYMVCGHLLRLFAILENPTLYVAKHIDLGAAREQDLLKDARSYIDKRKTHVSADELAQAMSFSKNYISRIFKKYLGQTVLQYNRNVCLQEAERLLLKTNLSVSEISRRVGFENRTHFYRLFREKYGVTPQEFRRSRL